MLNLKKFIREIPNFPQKGVNFKDITPLLQNKKAFRTAINLMARPYKNKKIDVIVGIDARGFILAAALAYKLGAGLAIIRKKGKLPWKTIFRDYKLEYATNTIEMHKDAIKPGQKVLLVDDVLATGGTMFATCEIVRELGGEIVGISFLIILDFLKGEEKLKGYKVHTLIRYK
ncbi:MAG: adenine phosphoribosyltransferase [Patescibacteria group bacterium]